VIVPLPVILSYAKDLARKRAGLYIARGAAAAPGGTKNQFSRESGNYKRKRS
jgi:hypothetical protein